MNATLQSQHPKLLTLRQAQVLVFIQEFQESHRYPPTYKDMQSKFGLSPNGVKSHLDALRKKGWVTGGTAQPGLGVKSRTLQLLYRIVPIIEVMDGRIVVTGILTYKPIRSES